MGRKSKNILSENCFIICKGVANDLSFEIHLADIIFLGSEGIVNPANKRLDHAGGLAAIISSLAGRRFSETCDNYLKGRWYLNPGEILVTDSFDLRHKGIKNIINVVGEIIETNKASFYQERNLRETIKNCILKAEENKLKSVSLPAISCGIFRFPLDQAAVCHLEGFILASQILKNSRGNHLKVVRFSFIQELEANEFLQCFLKHREQFTYFAFYDLPKNRVCHKFKYCGGCSGFFKKKLFSLLSCCSNYCNFCVCRYQFKYCVTCNNSGVMIDVENIIWCRECVQEVDITEFSRPLTCRACRSICSFHYIPGGKCIYCQSPY